MKQSIVIVTGLAGSGKTVALRALEDEGFYCVDNLPVTLIEPLTATMTSSDHTQKVGVGIDIREKVFLPALSSVVAHLRERYSVEIIFLEAEKEAIIRRFKETRRPHPLVSGDIDIERAIDLEKEMLLPLREEATRIIDTSASTPHQLRHLVSTLFKSPAGGALLPVTLISFGHKYGIPQSVDLLFDVRFIENPYFIPSLKAVKGTETAVRDFVMKKPETREFIEKTAGLLNFLIPSYISEGKAYLTVGFGCTGGKHRSPAIVEEIAPLIRHHPIEVIIVHRDLQE